MTQKQKIFNLIILDESGSMQSIKESVIRGFNETIQSIQRTAEMYPEQEQFITLVTFNGQGIKTLLSNQPVTSLKQLNGALYSPNHDTPLYDAMGMALTRLQTQLELLENHYVLVTIFTDGQENASKEWNNQAIKSLVESLRAKDWTFTYIGANHDVEQFAKSIAVPNTLQYTADAAGVSAAMQQDRYSR
jgi:uncharacterized protein YegL